MTLQMLNIVDLFHIHCFVVMYECFSWLKSVERLRFYRGVKYNRGRRKGTTPKYTLININVKSHYVITEMTIISVYMYSMTFLQSRN